MKSLLTFLTLTYSLISYSEIVIKPGSTITVDAATTVRCEGNHHVKQCVCGTYMNSLGDSKFVLRLYFDSMSNYINIKDNLTFEECEKLIKTTNSCN